MSEYDNVYRKAELIELHDSGIIVHPAEYSDATAGWREFNTISQVYAVEGFSLARIAEHFGIELKDRVVKDEKTRKTFTARVEDADYPVLRRLAEKIGSGHTSESGEGSHQIKELWARVLDPKLLAIRFVALMNPGQPDEESHTQEVTYAGSFSVWWSPR